MYLNCVIYLKTMAQEASIEALWDQYNAIEGKQERRAFYVNNIKERI